MKELTNTELKKIVACLDEIENETVASTKHMSGSFATASLIAFTDDTVYLRLKYGVKSDCSDSSYCDNIKMCRETMKVEEVN